MKERLTALEEQKILDEEAIEHQLKRKALDEEQARRQAELRHELDVSLDEKRIAADLEEQQLQVEAERMEIYLKTKRV